jgi:hypothetical protein
MRLITTIASGAVLLIFALGIWWSVRTTVVSNIELLDTLDRAERRPVGAAFPVTPVTVHGESHRAVLVPGGSRITWEVRLPRRAVLHVLVGLKEEAWSIEGDGVLFRIGIGEGRIPYEELVNRVVNPYGRSEDRRWIPLTVDLGPYSGFKWSLFYHPGQLLWRLVFNTNAGLPGSVDTRGDMPVWGEPRILY